MRLSKSADLLDRDLKGSWHLTKASAFGHLDPQRKDILRRLSETRESTHGALEVAHNKESVAKMLAEEFHTSNPRPRIDASMWPS